MDDPLVQYRISDTDTAGDPKYYGYLTTRGDWYIMCENSAAGTFRYFRGRGEYSTAWGNRAGHAYDYLDVIF